MSRVIAIANQKGGVGKTTTSVNLAAALAAVKKRVLLIDLDSQGNATTGFGVDKDSLEVTMGHVLVQQAEATEALLKPEHSTISLLPGGADLTAAELQLMQHDEREYRLQQALSALQDDFDYMLIDCPPALNILTVNALVAADGVLIPMQCEYYALEGLSALMGTIDSIRQRANPELEIYGILRTMFDPRSNLTRDVSAQLKAHFEDKLFNTVIPRNIRLAEAPSHGLPVLAYDKHSRGALAYLALAAESVRRDAAKKSH